MQKHEGENQDMVLVSNSCQCVKISKYLSSKLLLVVKTQVNMKQLVTSVGIIFNDSSWPSDITCASLKPNSKDWVMQLRKAFKHFLQLGKGWESQPENQERAQDTLGINNTFVELVTILLFFQHDSRSVWELPPAPRRGDAGDFFIVLDGWGYF